MVNVFDIAKWFLGKESMTHKKLQKLCYYAQAWHYTLLGEALFQDEVEAWIHGPVIPALYPIYADYGWREIPKLQQAPHFQADTMRVLEAVYNTYGEFSGDQLERLTHSEKPWRDARGDLPPYEPCENKISLQTMKEYYAKKYHESQGD